MPRPRRRRGPGQGGGAGAGVVGGCRGRRGSAVVQCRRAPDSTSIWVVRASRSSPAKRVARSRAAQRSDSAACVIWSVRSRSVGQSRGERRPVGLGLQSLEFGVQLVAVRAEPLEEAEGLLERLVLGHARVQRVLGGPHRRTQLEPELGQLAGRAGLYVRLGAQRGVLDRAAGLRDRPVHASLGRADHLHGRVHAQHDEQQEEQGDNCDSGFHDAPPPTGRGLRAALQR